MEKGKAMEKEKRKFYKKAFILFMAVMGACTLISRGADSMTIPQVTVQTPEQGGITSKLSGDGFIEASEKKTHLLPSGCLVETCLLAGTDVKPEDVLVQFQMEQLKQQEQELETELEKQKLLLEQAELGLVPESRVPEQEAAQNALTAAQAQLEAAAAAYQQAAGEYQQKLAELEQEKQSQQTQAEKEKDREKRSQLKKEAEDVYQQKKAALDEQLQAAAGVRQESQKSLDQAGQDLQTAQKNDSVTRQNEEKAQKEAGYGVESIRMETEQIQKKLDKVKELLAQEGKVRAKEAGTFLDTGIVPGTVTTGNEFISIGTGKFGFSAEIAQADQKKAAPGDAVILKIPGKGKLEGTVSAVLFQSQNQSRSKEAEEPAQGQTVLLKAELPKGTYTSGMQVSFSIIKESQEEYQNLLPLTALRKDSKGYYCLGIRKKDSILGEEIVAERINVTLLDKDHSAAAVDGPLFSDTKVIVESTRDVSPGDRVRIKE